MTCTCVPYQKHIHTTPDNREVLIWCRNLKQMLVHHVKKLRPTFLEDAEHEEVHQGRDHGQSACIFLAVVLIRCKTTKETHRLETKIGEINEEKDKFEVLKVLISKINYGLDSLKISIDGDCCVSMDSLQNISFRNNKSINKNENIHLVKFYMIGDLKGMFQLLGRNNCDSSYFI